MVESYAQAIRAPNSSRGSAVKKASKAPWNAKWRRRFHTKSQYGIHGTFFAAPPGHFFLFGPRGTGKTWWARRTFPEAIAGAALEGLVAQHLRAWCDYAPGNQRLFFWRTRSQVEVDFIVYGEEGIEAIEVKNSVRIRPEDLRGLKAFAADYPTARLSFLSRMRERLVIDGVTCLPVEEFLRGLTPSGWPGSGG